MLHTKLSLFIVNSLLLFLQLASSTNAYKPMNNYWHMELFAKAVGNAAAAAIVDLAGTLVIYAHTRADTCTYVRVYVCIQESAFVFVMSVIATLRCWSRHNIDCNFLAGAATSHKSLKSHTYTYIYTSLCIVVICMCILTFYRTLPARTMCRCARVGVCHSQLA